MTRKAYDYIVVGGGTSGSYIAAKMAEQGASVLVLEAGGSDRNPLIQMPAGYVKLLNAARYMWFFQSVRQEQLNGRTPVIPSGRVIGGGSSVNAMVYIRGQSTDYDRWVEATGDESWRYEHLLPLFRAIEGNNRFNDDLHGSEGPMKVSDPLHVNELSRAYVQAAQATGLPFKADFNRGLQTGAGFSSSILIMVAVARQPMLFSIRPRKRVSSIFQAAVSFIGCASKMDAQRA